MIRLLDYGVGGKQSMTKDKIRQVVRFSATARKEQGFFLGRDPQRHPAIVFCGSSGHYTTIRVSGWITKRTDAAKCAGATIGRARLKHTAGLATAPEP